MGTKAAAYCETNGKDIIKLKEGAGKSFMRKIVDKAAAPSGWVVYE